MHHVVVERWNRTASPLHALDARAKFGAIVIFLIAVSTTPAQAQLAFAAYAALLGAVALVSRLPLLGLLQRAALVLPFSATFAAITWWSGNPVSALALLEKSLLSGFAALLLVGTTPLPQLVGALDWLGAPRTLLLVIQFVYRYLFVISEQGQHMRLAARSRQGSTSSGKSRFRAAGGALGVLFARSSERADGIYHAMLARGFQGRFPSGAPRAFSLRDGLFLVSAAFVCVAARIAL